MPSGRDRPFFPAGNPRPTFTLVCGSSMYSPFALDVSLFAAVFTTIWRWPHANRSVHILIRPPLPNQRSESYIARSASSKLRSSKNLTLAVSSSQLLIQPLSLSSTASANNPAPGGAAVFCFAGAPLSGLGSSHFAGTLQESRPWHLGAVSHSRPPGGVP